MTTALIRQIKSLDSNIEISDEVDLRKLSFYLERHNVFTTQTQMRILHQAGFYTPLNGSVYNVVDALEERDLFNNPYTHLMMYYAIPISDGLITVSDVLPVYTALEQDPDNFCAIYIQNDEDKKSSLRYTYQYIQVHGQKFSVRKTFDLDFNMEIDFSELTSDNDPNQLLNKVEPLVSNFKKAPPIFSINFVKHTDGELFAVGFHPLQD